MKEANNPRAALKQDLKWAAILLTLSCFSLLISNVFRNQIGVACSVIALLLFTPFTLGAYTSVRRSPYRVVISDERIEMEFIGGEYRIRWEDLDSIQVGPGTMERYHSDDLELKTQAFFHLIRGKKKRVCKGVEWRYFEAIMEKAQTLGIELGELKSRSSPVIFLP